MPTLGFFLLCFNDLSAITIEITSIFVSFIGIITTIISINIIEWDIFNSLYKKIFIYGTGIFVLIILITISMVILRIKLVLYSKYNTLGNILSIIVVISSMLGFVIHILSTIFLFDTIISIKSQLQISQWLNPMIIFGFVSFIWILLIMTALSDNLRIGYRITGSYNNYLKAISVERVVSSVQRITMKEPNKIKHNKNVIKNEKKIVVTTVNNIKETSNTSNTNMKEDEIKYNGLVDETNVTEYSKKTGNNKI